MRRSLHSFRRKPVGSHPSSALPGAVLLLFLAAVAARAGEPKLTSAELMGSYQASVLRLYRAGERFENEAYFSLMASRGIRSADPKAVFERMTAAADGGEHFKALYFARILTNALPEEPKVWENRARLAAALGLEAEAVASAANAQMKGSRPVPPSVLPGTSVTTVKPKSLEDWAASVALLADDVARTEGPVALVAVSTGASGFWVGQDPDTGAYAQPEPILLEHVVPNLFVLKSAEAMKYKSHGGWGSLITGSLAGLSAGLTSDPTLAAGYADMAGKMLADFQNVPSRYQGGSFLAVTYPGGVRKESREHPQTTGEMSAIGIPRAMLWASGGSTAPNFFGGIQSHGKIHGGRYKVGKTKGKYGEHRLKPPALFFPKLQSICSLEKGKHHRFALQPYHRFEKCSEEVTLMELLLDREDIEAFSPGLEQHSRVVRELGWARELYRDANTALSVTLGNRWTIYSRQNPVIMPPDYVGIHPSGDVYVVDGKYEEQDWLVDRTNEPPSKKRKKKSSRD